MAKGDREILSWSVSRRRPRAASLGTALVLIVALAGCGDANETATPTTTATDGAATPAPRPGLPGIVELVAGNGSDDSAGRPGPAADASLGSDPTFAVAPNGDAFVISPAPVVLLVHDGQIEEIYTGAAGEFAFGGVAVGPDGDAYVTMSTGVRRIGADGSSEQVLDAAAEGLLLSHLGPIAFDDAGRFYFWNSTTAQVLRRDPDGSLTPVAGTGTQGPAGQPPAGDGGPATEAPLSVIDQLAVDGEGNLLIADSGQAVVRSVAPDGTISTIAGGGDTPMGGTVRTFVDDGTAATALRLGQVTGVAVDGNGRVYVADGSNHLIFRFEPGGGIELVIGDQADVVEEMGHAAFDTRATNVSNLVIDGEGNLVFLDRNSIRRIRDATD